MTPAVDSDWIGANQRALTAQLDRIAALLDRHIARAKGDSEATQPSRDTDGCDERPASAPCLDFVCERFGLSPFERDILLLCAGFELKSSFAALCASAQDDPRRAYPTFSLALAAFPDAHWSALSPQAPLRHWRLIQVSDGAGLVTSRLALDERILHMLVGVAGLDARLEGFVRPLEAEGMLPPSHEAQAERLKMLWLQADGPLPVAQVFGDDPAGARSVVARACGELGLDVLALRGDDLPTAVADRVLFARLVGRECILRPGVVLVDCGEGHAEGPLNGFIDQLHCPTIVFGATPVQVQRPLVRIEVNRPPNAEQKMLWRAAIDGRVEVDDETIEQLSAQFSLTGADIAAAARDAQLADGEPAASILWEAARVRARGGLDGLAQRIHARAGWEDLVLPEPQLALLQQIASQVRHRATVYERWGFAAKSSRGLGISALFTGESGTGKTLAAEVLARDLRLDLFRIDLSAVVSKYIGETEKNLRWVFDAAEGCGAVLLFDEADALFGKRSEVKDSHDRYANIELAYLLQRMEAYRGLAILTTNVKTLLDAAFLRRIRFVVTFPFPDAAQREAIWRRMFPEALPIDGVRMDRLARLNVAGGAIRNIAVNASFLAVNDGTPLAMPHLHRAARVEFSKLEKPFGEVEP